MIRRKRSIIVGAIVGALIAASVAVAYLALFSGTSGTTTITGGTGNGTGATQPTAAVQISATPSGNWYGGTGCNATNGIGPGCSEGLILNATNLDNADTHGETLQTIGQPVITVDSGHPSCDPTWLSWSFDNGGSPSLSLAEGAANVPIFGNGNQAGRLTESNTTQAQNGCVGATITLAWVGGTTTAN